MAHEYITFLQYFGAAAASVPALNLLLSYKNGHKKEEEGLIYEWFDPSSHPNPLSLNVAQGRLHSKLSEVKEFSDKNKKAPLKIFVDQFRLDEDYFKKSKMPKFLKNKYEKTDIYFDAKQIAKGALGIGSAGSGKTEMIMNIVNQKVFKKEVYNSKKGDFEQFLYRKGIDIMLNPKLNDGVIHDILSEHVQYIQTYISTLMNATLGKSQDYFSGSAKQKLEKFMQKIKIKEASEKDYTVAKKWKDFVNFYLEAVEEANAGTQKSEKDVMSTVRATVETLYLLAYRIENGARTFTVKEFFENKDKHQRLFLSMTDKSVESLNAASFAVLVQYQLQMPDIKTYDENFLVGYFLDEYLSLAEVCDDIILQELSRVGRSKGICSFKFFQSFPTEQKEILELTQNFQYLFIFSTVEPKTLKIIEELVGSVKYRHDKPQYSMKWGWLGQKKEITGYSTEIKEVPMVDVSKIQTLEKQGYYHYTFAPKENLLYKAYTPQVAMKQREYIDFNEIDLAKFYEWKNNIEDKSKNIQNISKSLLSDAISKSKSS